MKPFRFEFGPLRRPLIIRAGEYLLADRNFERNYLLEEFHALHLYMYNCVIRTDDAEYAIAPGDITITPAGEWTRYAAPTPGRHLCAHFELSPGTGEWELPFHCPASRLSGVPTGAFAELIDTFRDAAVPENRTAAEDMLSLLLFRLHRQMAQQAGSPDARSRQLAQYLDARFEHSVSIPALAARFHVSQTHLTRNFRRAFGVTIGAYVMRKRIEKACYLLAISRMSVKEIGMAVGYSSAQEFNKRFHQIAGTSPSAYRLRH